MKKLLLILALAAGTVATTTQTAQAQPGANCNIGMQPMWGPTGYDYADYYYMPDIDAYYSINSNQFICQQGGQWGYYNSLPNQYSNYDLYNGYKVVINGQSPWLRNTYYRSRYAGYRGRRNQAFIRNSRDYRYFQNPNHPYHNQWRGDSYGYGRGGNRGGRYSDGYNGRGGYGGHRGNGYRQDNSGGYDRGGYDNRGNGTRGNNSGGWSGRGGERPNGGNDNNGYDNRGRGNRGNDNGGWNNRGGDRQNGGGNNEGGEWRGGRR